MRKERRMNVLIVAAGLGTRVSDITFQVIPKFIINLDNFNGLYHILTYWRQYTQNIFLVLHPIYHKVTEFYVNEFFPELNLTYIFYESSDGTAFTIQSICKKHHQHFKDNPLLITWCDIYPSEEDKIDFSEITEDVTIFTFGNECRYKFDNELQIIKNVGSTGGDVIGIYYIKDYLKLFDLSIEKGSDIVDYFQEIGTLQSYPLHRIYDFGDKPKLIHLRDELNLQSSKEPSAKNPTDFMKKKKIQHRHFNEILINNGRVFKRGINEQGKNIIKKEIQWYRYLLNHRYSNDFNFPIPKIYSLQNEYYMMEYLDDYIPYYQYLNQDEKNIDDFEKVWEIVKTLHWIEEKKMDKIEYIWNIKYEIYDKILERKKEIEPLLESLSTIEFVNGLRIDSFDVVLNRVKKIILEAIEKQKEFKYRFIHGDLNFSNIMIHPKTKDIRLIDPRGYFGKSEIFGWKEYDEAKLLYGLSGYDNFNSDLHFQPTQISSEKEHIEFSIPSYNLPNHHSYFTKVHHALLTIIWLGLAQYNKNNYWKCICSYYHGLYLGTKLNND